MSRKGKLPIPLPSGVEVKVTPSHISVKGPKGILERQVVEGVEIKVKDNHIHVELAAGYENSGNLHGLFRSLIANMVMGTTEGYKKELEMIGVGYRAAVSGQQLDLQIGFSHPTKLDIPQGIQVKVEKNTTIMITGIDKQGVGQFAAIVRAKRPPEPYQGKGIRHKGEYVRKKAGKAAAKK